MVATMPPQIPEDTYLPGDWGARVSAAAHRIMRELRAGAHVAGAVIPTPVGTITITAAHTRGRAFRRPGPGLRVIAHYRVGPHTISDRRWLGPGRVTPRELTLLLLRMASAARARMAVAVVDPQT